LVISFARKAPLIISTTNQLNGNAESFLILGCFLIFLGIAIAFRMGITGQAPLEYDEKDTFEVEYAKKFIAADRKYQSSFKWAPRVMFCLGAISLVVALAYFVAS
jgi:hypothetical protein